MFVQVLSKDRIGKIHENTLAVLERVGVQVPHDEILRRFADSGAVVNFETQRVRIPAGMVTRALETCGKQFIIYGRDLSRKAAFGYGERNYNSNAGEAHWVEHPGGPRCYVSLNDVATASRISDALDCINVAGAMADPYELPISWRCVEVMATMIRNTVKPIHFWLHDRKSARFLVEMTTALRGNEKRAAEFPIFYPFLEPISPLRFAFNGVDLLFETSRLNLPVPIGPMAQMGLSAPCSLVATMTQENAEILAGICITQLIKPGMPVCYGGIPHAFDMKTTQLIFDGPEQAILGVAMTEIGKSYGLPVYINVGMTDSKRPDAQAGIEAGITLALGAAAGADIFGHMGISGVDQASSLDILIMQDEIISYIESMLRELDFSDDAFALEEIEQVGPGGTYIDREHTARRFRKELWFPKLLDRDYYQAWLDSGAKSMEDRCRERKEDLLQNYQPEPCPEEMVKVMDEITAAARRELS